MKGILIGRRPVRLLGAEVVIDAGSLGNLSAIAVCESGDGTVLWLAGDEAVRFGPSEDKAAKAAKRNALEDGMLWLTGSHASNRKKPKAADADAGRADAAGRQVAKHFVYLGGMGVRDLAVDDDDLLILAGPTMDVDGTQAVWRLARPDQLDHDSLTGATGSDAWNAGRLVRLFDLPTDETGERAEGLCCFEQTGEQAVLVAYDRTSSQRHLPGKDKKPIPEAVYLDLFRLPPA